MKTISTRFIIKNDGYLNDLQDIPRSFSPYLIIDKEAEDFLEVSTNFSKGIFCAKIESSFYISKKIIKETDDSDIIIYKRETKKFLKKILYDYLSEFFDINLPYGCITGVRPTRIYYDLIKMVKNPLKTLIEEFKVAEEKALLIENVVENQKDIYEINEKNADIFINIPFCPTRCNYCSFISCIVSKVENDLPQYVESVKKELEYYFKLIKENKYKLKSIYVGGGTPTSINPKYLDEILSSCKDSGVEFSVEAGRPDTINNEVLNVLKKNNVTRISINPQTFNDKTLKKIGRKHTVEDFYNSYFMAREYGFEINMDLIALLEDESYEDFVYSVNKAIELRPENLTIHTLSLKKGSDISERKKYVFGEASKMVSYAYKRLAEEGYSPYYMYRQKNMADNLENVGFCLNGKRCIYNIDMMEETNTIFGAGAGAMTKKLFGNNRIERECNPKEINTYFNKIDKKFSKI